LGTDRPEAGGQVIRAHPGVLPGIPDRVIPLRHLPDRIRTDNDVYCLLDMDNTSGRSR
jgi:hypothetical protein